MVEKSRNEPTAWWPGMFEPLRTMGERIADYFAPSADAAATGDNYEINVELPGVEAKDIDIQVHDGTLTVKGEKRIEREEKGKTYFFSERAFGSFQRTFRLPGDVDADAITAGFKDGVLTLQVPKSGPPPEKTKRIEIKQN